MVTVQRSNSESFVFKRLLADESKQQGKARARLGG